MKPHCGKEQTLPLLTVSGAGFTKSAQKPKMARIGSNGDVYQMFETRLDILVQTLIWKTSKHGQRGAILFGGRELVRGLRGTRTFHLFHLVCKFPWIFAWFGLVWVLLCLVGVFVLVGFCFRGNLISFFTHSSC